MKNKAWFCPKCGKEHSVIIAGLDIRSDFLYADLTCKDCQISWTESFKLEYNGCFYCKEYDANGREVVD